MLKKKVKNARFVCQFCECEMDLNDKTGSFTKWVKLSFYEDKHLHGQRYGICLECWKKVAGKEFLPEN